MSQDTLGNIRRAMDEQLARRHYPEGFPALPGVPTARFYDPGFAAAEMEHLWKKTWLMVGVESELARDGSYFLFEQLGLSVIVRRDKDGGIGAFYNTCRHRASALLQEPTGRVARFICPYHSWGYSLSGDLVSVPEAHDFACLNKADFGLSPVRCDVWRGLIFINLSPEGGSLADFMAPVVGPMTGFPFENLVVKDHYFIEMDCNWKLAYHNFIEGYHTTTVHPQSLAPYLQPQTLTVALLNHGHARITVARRDNSSIYSSEAAIADEISPVFKELSNVLSTFPNCYAALDPGGFAFQNFWPVGEKKSVLEIRLVGWESSPSDEAYWNVMRTSFQAILAEDLRLFPGMQHGVEKGALSHVLMGFRERALYWMEEEIDRRIGVKNIPEPLRVAQVLSGQVDH